VCKPKILTQPRIKKLRQRAPPIERMGIEGKRECLKVGKRGIFWDKVTEGGYAELREQRPGKPATQKWKTRNDLSVGGRPKEFGIANKQQEDLVHKFAKGLHIIFPVVEQTKNSRVRTAAYRGIEKRWKGERE